MSGAREPRRVPTGVAGPYPLESEALVACSATLSSLDMSLAGGLDRGTSTLLLGAAGSGKSSLATR